jgi:hypothetical protein
MKELEKEKKLWKYELCLIVLIVISVISLFVIDKFLGRESVDYKKVNFIDECISYNGEIRILDNKYNFITFDRFPSDSIDFGEYTFYCLTGKNRQWFIIRGKLP